MNNVTRILIVEDQSSDYDLAQREIRKSLQQCIFEQVKDQDEFLHAIGTAQPDIILSDYNLPSFDGKKSLALAQKHCPSTPVIIWTGAMSEDVAVECMKEGASNYVIKDNLKRLGPVIAQALKERKAILERKQAEEKYQSIFENSPVGIFQSSPQGRFISVNPAMAHIHGYDSPGEMIDSITDIAHQIYTKPEERLAFTKLLETQQVVQDFEWQNKHKDGSFFWTSTSARVVRDELGNILYYEGFLQDITSRKKAEEKLIENEKRFRALIEHGMDSISLLSKDGTLLWENPASHQALGYEPGEFIDRNIFELMHPDDIDWTRDLFSKLVHEPGSIQHEVFRLQHRDGGWRWMEATATNMLAEPGVGAVVINYRDITERKNAQDKLHDSERRYRALFEDMPIAIWEEDFSELKKHLDSLKQQGVQDFQAYFESQPNILFECANKIRILDLNNAALQMYEADGKENLIASTNLVMSEGERRHHHEDFIAIAEGRTNNGWEGADDTLKGAPIEISLNWSVVPGHEEDYSKVIVTTLDITGRKQTEGALREERNLLRTLIDNLPDRIYVIDADGRKTLSNTADWRASGGKTMEDVIGKTDLDTYPPELAEQFWRLDKAVLDSGEPVINYEEPGLDFEGNPVLILTTKIPLRDDEGNVIGLVGVGRDITERKQAEAAEREQRVLAEALRDTSQILSGTLDYRDVLDHILTTVGRVVPHDAATIMLIDEAFAHVVRSQGYQKRDPNTDIMSVKFSLVETTNLRQMLETKRPVVIYDTFSYPGWQSTEATDWLRSNVGAPISIYGEIIGFILLDSQTPGFFTHVHAERLEAFASQAALAIHNSRLLQQAQEEIGERIRVEQALMESNIQFRTLFDASPEAIMLVEPQGDCAILDCNATGCAMNGYTREELVGQSVDIFNLKPGNPTERSEYLESVRKAGILRYETSHRRKDGTVFPIEVSTSLITLGGREVILGIDRDITERKSAEQALRESEALYRQAIEVAGAVPYYESYYDNGRSIKYEFIGEGIRQITGYGPEEFNAKIWDSLVEEVNLVEELAGYSLDEGIQRVRSGENPIWKCEHCIRARDGKIHWVFEAAVELRDEQGVARGSIGTYQDITTRKQADAELRASEERFRQLATNIEEAFWMTDAQTDREIYISPAAATIWGNSVEYFMHTPDGFLNCIVKEDRAMVLASLERQRKGAKTEIEYRVIRPDGSIRWIWDRAFPIFDENGKVKILAGIAADITERKLDEERLRASEERYHSLFQNLVDGFALHEIITDDQGKPVDYLFLEVNPAFEKLTGLSAQNIIGRRVNEVLPPLDNERSISIYGQVALTGKPVHFEEYSVPLGRYYEINAYSPRHGQFAVTFVDITERKQAEENLRAEQKKAQNYLDIAGVIMLVLDQNGVVTLINQKGVEILGYSYDEIIGRNWIQTFLPMNDREKLQQVFEPLAGGDTLPVAYYENPILTKAGEKRLIAWHNNVIQNSQGQIVGTLSSGEDITERKRTEEEISRRAKETSALLATSLALTNLDLRAILQSIGNSAQNLFSADGCRIFLMQPDGESLRCVLALQEHSSAYSDLRIKIGEGVTGAVAASGQAEIVNQMHKDPRGVQVPNTQEDEEEAIMFAPIKERDRAIGVLSVRRAGAERPFQPADLELLEAFASMAASAVSNARLFEEAQRRLAELEALYENGLAVGQLLGPREIGSRIIETFAHHLSWHHVAIRLLNPETDELEMIAINQAGLSDKEKLEMEHHFNTMVHSVEQGLSGWAVKTGIPLRTGNVHEHSQYVNTQAGIESGLYMPLKIGDRVIGVISVESEMADAFTAQDERLLATLANQAAIAFENARLYQAAQQEIFERKQAQTALLTSESHYHQLADSITDILFELDHDLHYTYWNKASEMFSGIPEEDAVGRTIQEVFGNSQDQLGREEIYKSVLQDRQARMFETEVIAKGQKRILEINAYPSASGVAAVAKDVTERKLGETLMQKRFELMEYSAHHSLEELMQNIVDEASQLTDSHIGFLHFVEENQEAIFLQAWSSETLETMEKVEEQSMHHPLDSGGVWADAVRQRRPVIDNDYESLRDKNGLAEGHVKVIREMAIPIIRDEKIAAVLGIGNKAEAYTLNDLETVERYADYAWDITERKQMENALADERNQLARRVEERTSELSRANSNLARALHVKDEFLANMSHELRTPLNAILGLSESLGEQIAGPLNEKQQKYLATINESGHHLLSLINDILDLAKIEAGQITLDINKVDVNSVCQASLRMIKQLSQRKNQDVTFEIDDDIGLMWADERRLKQMMVNLLSNAVKFTPESGSLGLEVRGDKAGNKVIISVWDQGIGIGEHDIERLFRPFIQLDSGLAREATGTGLGLALVAQMARLHGGSVSVTSQLGVGSRFIVQLPWEPALATETNIRLRSTGKFQAIDPNAKNKPTILLIEDTQEVVMMLVDYLEMAGYNMATAQDGIDGLTQAKLCHPDLILMDIQMPRMDGFETTQKLRNDPEFKDTPIIALTALAMPNDRQRCLDAGMDEYMSKPVNLKALAKTIKKILLENKDETSS